MDPKPKRNFQATVIGDSDAPAEVCQQAKAIGAMLARLGITVITGGGAGVMEAACRGAREAGGTTVGIIPGSNADGANPWCSVTVATGLGHARNMLTVLSGDLVIALGSSAGTLSEVCFAWIYGKPILTVIGGDGWLAKLGTEVDQRGTGSIIQCLDLAALENAVAELLHNRSRIGSN